MAGKGLAGSGVIFPRGVCWVGGVAGLQERCLGGTEDGLRVYPLAENRFLQRLVNRGISKREREGGLLRKMFTAHKESRIGPILRGEPRRF